jgi:isopenicillin N synthase-like dioxygenase
MKQNLVLKDLLMQELQRSLKCSIIHLITPRRYQIQGAKLIPIIDLANIHDDPSARKKVVESVRDASETFGFFQIVNHGIPVSTLKEMKDGVLNFYEQDSEVKKKFYTREPKPFMYYSNITLFTATAATWKDSFLCNMAPVPPKPEDLPDICR